MKVRRLTKKVTASGVLAAVAVFSACDLEVTNPGPVQDATLSLEGAHQGIVNGAIRAVQEGFGTYALLGGAITHDVMASGHTGSAGVRPEEEVAALSDEYDGRGGWSNLHRARWVAEEAIRRFQDPESGVNAGNYPPLAQAYFWAGLASRYLGENACSAVFDGGAPEPKLTYFDRAIDHFDNAISVGGSAGLSDMVTAATGARAAAKLFKGDFGGARSDAQQIPFDFEFLTTYSGVGGEYYYVYGHVESLGFQSLSFWGTPAADHFLRTGDARVAFGYDNGSREVPSGKSAAVRGQTHPARPTWSTLVPMFYPLKGIAPRDPEREFLFFEPDRAQQRANLQVELVDGREMALIMAEVELQTGSWQTAMTHINDVRTSTPVYPIDMTDPSKFDLSLHPDEQKDWDANPDMAAYFDHNSYTLKDFTEGADMTPMANMMVGDRMMPEVVATNADEAWSALKFERYVELSMEARRFGDRWRWRANAEPVAPSSGPGGQDTPGEYTQWENIPPSLAARYNMPVKPLMMCFPLPQGENNANQNIAEDFKDWVPRP